MAVNLSPVGGVAAQFFTNSGAPLTGGKIFTYAAGTTTPAVAYTSSNGLTAWTNPIVLDAAGRVPSGGEIWLTDGINYKFVLKDANDVLIATYDNISGINSNFVAYTNSQEIQTATAGQTVFTLTTMQYQPGTNSLSVFVDGVNQYGPGAQYSYVETDSTTVTFNAGLHVGAEVKFTTTQQQGAGAVDASQVTYDPPFTGSVPTNVEVKLSEYVSPEDFGAVGDGVTDDIDALIAAHQTGKTVNYTAGKTYYVEPSVGDYSKAVPIYEGQVINGNGASILCTNGGLTVFLIEARANVVTHHINGINVNNFFIASNKTGYANNGPLDFEYFLTIRGGYIMMSSFTNLSAAATVTGTNPSCRAVVYFDLNDPNGSGDVGAPDGITISDMYLLGAYGTSCGVLFDGSTSSLPNNSRVGKVQLSNIYLGCINPVDFDDRNSSTGKSAPVIFNKCDMGYGSIDTLYGGVTAIRLYDGSVVRNTPITGLYNELVSPQSSAERGLVWADSGCTFAQCIFESPEIYALGANFAPSYNYKMFDGTFVECQIARPYIYENDLDPAQIPSDLINLSASSYGNQIDILNLFGTYSSQEDQANYAQKFVTCSQSNTVGSWVAPYRNEVRNLAIGGAGNTKIFEVPPYVMEQLDMYRIRIVAKATSGTINAFASTTVALSSATTTFSGSNNVHVIEGTIYMNAQSKALNTQVPCFVYGEWITMHNGGNFTNVPSAGSINTRTTALPIYVQTTGAVDILTATIQCLRGEYTNKF